MLPALLASTILPGWVVLPLGGMAMLAAAVHVLGVQLSPHLSERRRRLRIASGVVMMFVSALLTYALGIAPEVVDARAEPGRARAFVLVWLAIVGLIGILVAIALADAVATTAAGYRQHRRLAREMRDSLEADLVARAGAARPAGGAGAVGGAVGQGGPPGGEPRG